MLSLIAIEAHQLSKMSADLSTPVWSILFGPAITLKRILSLTEDGNVVSGLVVVHVNCIDSEEVVDVHYLLLSPATSSTDGLRHRSVVVLLSILAGGVIRLHENDVVGHR
jgi:hypothetical protein